MPSATFDSILGDLEKKIYHPVYLLEGEEPYFIERIADYIEENVLEEAARDFNLAVYYGKDTDSQTVIDTARRAPMMSSHQVVILREAQQMRDLSKLQPYIENPLPSTLIVLCHKYKKLDKRTNFARAIGKKAVVFTSNKLYDNQVPAWINQYLGNRQYRITPKAAQLLTEYLGNNLANVANELEKLILVLPDGKEIDDADIEKNIGISKDYNIFELQNALVAGDSVKAFRIVNYFNANTKAHPLVLVMGGLYAFFSKVYQYHALSGKPDRELAGVLKINPYFVKDYKAAGRRFSRRKTEQVIHELHRYDLRSKGIHNANVKDGELLKELVYHIMH